MSSKFILSIVCYFWATILPMGSLKIIESPEANVWVEEQKNVSLLCISEQPWQWCYWELETAIVKTLYQTGQEYTTLKTYDPRVQFFQLNEHSCGIQISGASPAEHQVFLIQKCLYSKILQIYSYTSNNK